MATSRVPAAIEALLAIWRAAPDLAGVQILDGPPVVDQAAADYLLVGWSPNTELSVEFTQDFNAAGARTRDEEFSILCYLETWTGDSDVAARRTRAFELLAVCEETVRASGSNPTAPTLNGAVLWAEIASGSLIQASTDKGVRAAIPFVVTCRARI
ncbi:hypothetical protein [Streptomyces violaceusniger]|uniref:Uncharacterized protein n=1 Tax=Streptomyces violaceusniger (strain Tu 4113) TaxID=653045 RepID=G2P7C6_STRV4|nr:hypothetical protein [Streptomyces violaceusniger]AEM87086.1 hypothetical protein Strvi_7751 [Streptomyces violaceusniger Tu 4113]